MNPSDNMREGRAGTPMRRRNLLRMAAAASVAAVLAACGGSKATDTPKPAGTAAPSGTTAPATTTSSAAATTAPAATTATGSAAVATRPAGSAAASGTTAPATTGTTAAGSPASSLTSATGNLSVSKSGFKGTLQYWVLGYAPGNATAKLMDAAVAIFTKANPDIKVEITGYTGDQAGFTKLTQAVQGGGSVDMFRLPSDILPLLVQDNLVAPIDDFLTADDKGDIFPSLLDSVRVNGKAYSWPLWVPPVGMYLNLDIFKEKGVTPPKGDWTYDQFVEIAKQLTFQRANGDKVYGYTGGIDPGLVNTWPFILNDGSLPLSTDNTKYTFNSPEGISGLQKLVDLAQKHKVTPPDFGTQSVADIASSFQDKKLVAMYSEPSGSSSGYRSANLNFDVVAMPTGKTGKPGTAGGIGLISVATNKDKAKLQAAMDLGRYLTSAQVGTDVSGFYLAPGARKSVKVADPINKFDPFVPNCYITPIIADWPQIRTIIHPNIQNAVFGKITADQAMNNPAKEINDILAKKK
jgi:multiple sugar transport system substrate-binding protein